MDRSLARVARTKDFARLGRYELGRELGSGGMGRVVEATHHRLGKRVAIKSFHPHLATKSDSLARFVREGQAVAQLRHPHVVEVFDLDETEDGVPYLVMELLEGRTLAEHLASEAPLSVKDAIDLILPLASALAAAHAAGIVHRDVKPSNIFLRGGRIADPCLVDFGVSKHAALDDLTQSGVIIGSYPYFSPEHTRGGKHVTAQSDLYSLAAVLYECSAGAPPFAGNSAYELMHTIATTDVKPPSLVRPDLPRELDEVIVRAMDRDPLRRYPSMRAFGSALLGLASRRTWQVWSNEFAAIDRDRGALERTAEEEGPGAPALAAAPTRTARRRAFHSRRYLGPTVALAVALAGAAVVFVHGGHDVSKGAGVETPFAPAVVANAERESPRPEPLAPAESPAFPELATARATPATQAVTSVVETGARVPSKGATPPPAVPRLAAKPIPVLHAPSRTPGPSPSAAPPAAERGSNGVPILD